MFSADLEDWPDPCFGVLLGLKIVAHRIGLLNIAVTAVHAVVLYAWVIFPMVLYWLARARPARPVRMGESLTFPPITLILSAYNEEEHIGERIRNLQQMEYPSPWRALIGIDGSRDATAAVAHAAAGADPRITVLDFPENRGKVSVLKDLVAHTQRRAASDEILVFTDANTAFAPGALQRLSLPFSDPTVGGVCGRLRFIQPAGGTTEENAYWRAENWLKVKESAVDSCLGANGAIYAIRPSLFWRAIPSNTIIDDFVIGMKVHEQNYRMIYEPNAVAEEELPPAIHDEWKRRVRIGAGNFQSLGLCRASLSPSSGVFAWIFWSHKVLRWFTPHLMIAGMTLAIAAAAGSQPWLGRLTVLCYLLFGATAIVGWMAGSRGGRVWQFPRGILYLLAMQAALFAGFLRFCRGNLNGRWQRTTRESGPAKRQATST
jgi:cellulose synthase/poly-beta-1,6-N-acetylglucosamine synthase-like glycosyltransferase